MPHYRYEGVAYTVDMGNAANDAPLYRFYNKAIGTHFYTADANETANVMNTMSATYTLDGPAFFLAP
jgi:Repeat of unknown function (DUF5648)